MTEVNNGLQKAVPAFSHRSVLLDECIESLAIQPDGVYVDGTLGGAGHSSHIAEHLSKNGRLIGIDRDETAIAVASARLAVFGTVVSIHRHNFSELEEVLEEAEAPFIDGMLLDLGVSSYQLDTPERGFTFQKDAPLDMRMDVRQSKSAYTVVNEYSEADIRRILYEYGEERFAPRIAAKIVQAREEGPIDSTGKLVSIIESALPAGGRECGHHPATKSFQAIRIEVNGELSAIEPTIRCAVRHMRPGAKMAIITFHSLEDRIVKQTYQSMAQGCTCPKNLPVCVCGNKPKIRIDTKKPIVPGPAELNENPRSRSAKLRVFTRLDENGNVPNE